MYGLAKRSSRLHEIALDRLRDARNVEATDPAMWLDGEAGSYPTIP
jgi:hypothetical protein